MIEELPVGQKAPGKPAAQKQEILTQPPLAEVQANEERQVNLLQEYEQRFEKLSEDQKFSRLMLRSRFEISRNWTILLCSSVTKRKRKAILMAENIRYLEIKKELVSKGGSKAMYDLALCRT